MSPMAQQAPADETMHRFDLGSSSSPSSPSGGSAAVGGFGLAGDVDLVDSGAVVSGANVVADGSAGAEGEVGRETAALSEGGYHPPNLDTNGDADGNGAV